MCCGHRCCHDWLVCALPLAVLISVTWAFATPLLSFWLFSHCHSVSPAARHPVLSVCLFLSAAVIWSFPSCPDLYPAQKEDAVSSFRRQPCLLDCLFPHTAIKWTPTLLHHSVKSMLFYRPCLRARAVLCFRLLPKLWESTVFINSCKWVIFCGSSWNITGARLRATVTSTVSISCWIATFIPQQKQTKLWHKHPEHMFYGQLLECKENSTKYYSNRSNSWPQLGSAIL